jgi:hypothetical protein
MKQNKPHFYSDTYSDTYSEEIEVLKFPHAVSQSFLSVFPYLSVGTMGAWNHSEIKSLRKALFRKTRITQNGITQNGITQNRITQNGKTQNGKTQKHF